jgi:hypothetical protein
VLRKTLPNLRCPPTLEFSRQKEFEFWREKYVEFWRETGDDSSSLSVRFPSKTIMLCLQKNGEPTCNLNNKM